MLGCVCVCVSIRPCVFVWCSPVDERPCTKHLLLRPCEAIKCETHHEIGVDQHEPSKLLQQGQNPAVPSLSHRFLQTAGSMQSRID